MTKSFEQISKPVRKNSKQFKAVIEGARNVRAFTLDNGFSGASVDGFPSWVSIRDIDLVRTAKGYTARLHSNLWFEFEAA